MCRYGWCFVSGPPFLTVHSRRRRRPGRGREGIARHPPGGRRGGQNGPIEELLLHVDLLLDPVDHLRVAVQRGTVQALEEEDEK